MLRIDRSKLKWKAKLEGAFDSKKPVVGTTTTSSAVGDGAVELSDKELKKIRAEQRSGRWSLFLLPLITVLREGLEAVVFVGGVSRLLRRVDRPVRTEADW